MSYEKIQFGVTGIIRVNSPDGVLKITTPDLKATLLRIEAVNILLSNGQNVKSRIKDDEVLKDLIQKISGVIEIVSFETV